MVHRVFFCFHFERDIWRASQVRNSWVTKPDREAAGFWDAAAWEEVKKKGDEAIKSWIRNQLEGTSVTVALIGTNTSDRKYVHYEINQSWDKKNGLIGVYIHNKKDQNGKTDIKGFDPFVKLGYTGIRTYDWVNDNGYENLGKWIEAAAYERAQNRT
ncbi:TIR domain-containing protein [candidate division KSB1 bacterium]|nr:TIR domain-containing protein [candidate division KSB1 bacterium]